MTVATRTCSGDGPNVPRPYPAESGLKQEEPNSPTESPTEASVSIYYIAWRLKPSHPWRSEEFLSRFDAHCEYFARLKRGMEVYLEVRRRPVG